MFVVLFGPLVDCCFYIQYVVNDNLNQLTALTNNWCRQTKLNFSLGNERWRWKEGEEGGLRGLTVLRPCFSAKRAT